MKNIKKLKSAIKISVYFLLIPALIIVGTALFNNKQYVLVAAGIAALSFIPVFLSFEKGRHNERELLPCFLLFFALKIFAERIIGRIRIVADIAER